MPHNLSKEDIKRLYLEIIQEEYPETDWDGKERRNYDSCPRYYKPYISEDIIQEIIERTCEETISRLMSSMPVQIKREIKDDVLINIGRFFLNKTLWFLGLLIFILLTIAEKMDMLKL